MPDSGLLLDALESCKNLFHQVQCEIHRNFIFDRKSGKLAAK